MTGSARKRLAVGAVWAAAAVAVGCSPTTYGTGKRAGLQTVEDLVGIASLSGPGQEPIDYEPRAPVVAPPTTTLPPPGGDATLAANWPDDPDEEAKRLRANAKGVAYDDDNLPLNSKDPVIRLPPRPPPDQPRKILLDIDPAEEARTTKAQNEELKRLTANARGLIAVDEDGNPVRRFLTEPPADYLAHDPNSPVEVAEKPKKKFKWPWQR